MTVDMAVLPGVLWPRNLRRTIQVRLGFEPLRLPGGTVIFTDSRHRFMNYRGWGYDSPNKQNGVVEKNLAGKVLLLTLAPSDII